MLSEGLGSRIAPCTLAARSYAKLAPPSGSALEVHHRRLPLVLLQHWKQASAQQQEHSWQLRLSGVALTQAVINHQLNVQAKGCMIVAFTYHTARAAKVHSNRSQSFKVLGQAAVGIAAVTCHIR